VMSAVWPWPLRVSVIERIILAKSLDPGIHALDDPTALEL
jgi:hypothetical protein